MEPALAATDALIRLNTENETSIDLKDSPFKYVVINFLRLGGAVLSVENIVPYEVILRLKLQNHETVITRCELREVLEPYTAVLEVNVRSVVDHLLFVENAHSLVPLGNTFRYCLVQDLERNINAYVREDILLHTLPLPNIFYMVLPVFP